jgi:nicotinamidase-related amidase
VTAIDHDSWQKPPSVHVRPPLVPSKTAVVVVDMMNWNVPWETSRSGLAPGYYVNRLKDTVVLNNARLLAACRPVGITVVFLRVGCAQADFSDMVPAIRVAVRLSGAVDGSTVCEVIPELLRDGDLTLLKTGSGGFNSS